MTFHGLTGAALAVALLTGPAAADLRVATWNVDGVQKTPEALAENAQVMLGDVGRLDILVIQEVINSDQVAAVAEATGLRHWAISDFSPPVSITGFAFRSLEVAVLSRVPIEQAVEWDTTGWEVSGDGHPPRVSNPNAMAEELPPPISLTGPRPARGFLRTTLADGLIVYAVHWTSSRGEVCETADLENATLRELQAEGLVVDARPLLDAGLSILVAGDFNVGALGSGLHPGMNLDEDCRPVNGSCERVCGPEALDGYDDSVALLQQLDRSAELLSDGLGDTFIADDAADGALDHILVAGPLAATFERAATVQTQDIEYAGSDRVPVFARSTAVLAAPPSRVTELMELRALVEEMLLRLDRLEQMGDDGPSE
ncbi:MAG: endonuclease/exonuclease/phosphatase family protein [Pseudomonadota bacterium]